MALDFVNTVSGRPTYSRDDLAGPGDVYQWAAAAGLLDSGQPVGPPVDESAQFHELIALRESLYHVFGAIAHGLPPESPAMDFLVRRGSHALRSAQWEQTESGLVPRWSDVSLESISDRLADEAVALLRRPTLSRVGFCAGCGWLFLDTSRGHARRWCSMNACGVRDKMRRYHQRQSHETSPV
jgi:predicted RNA-binding Zn ribbon-like protein